MKTVAIKMVTIWQSIVEPGAQTFYVQWLDIMNKVYRLYTYDLRIQDSNNVYVNIK